MRRAGWHWLSFASLALVACDGREMPVFELPAHVGGTGSSAGSSSAGADSANAGSSAGKETTTAGTSSAGSAVGGGAGAGGAGGSSPGGGSSGTYGNTAGGPGTGSGDSCGDQLDCMPGWICEKQGCDAPMGVCVPWPPACFPNYNPVCGCDGVTYWNDCLRLRSGARLAGADICRAGACTCEVGSDCNVPYASCSHLLPPGETMCGHGEGACWVLPPQCPPPPQDAKLWRECKPPEQGGMGGCLDMCSAIATEHSYAELHRGDVCQ